tara:strand:- start:225 stop:608 length:384 start_codon:yes stop_codon:yes gene_type:complete
MSKKKYSTPLDIIPNSGSWYMDQMDADYPLSAGPLTTSSGITYSTPSYGIFDIDMPVHPEYAKVLSPSINVGDLVETHSGEVGIVVSVEKPKGFFLQIKEANNNYYTVLIGEAEKKYVGYSLKKIKK